MRIFVDRHNIIPFDSDGNLRDTYLEPVPGVVLCTGVVEKKTDSSGHIHWTSPLRTRCDTTWDTVATGSAMSDPIDTYENPAGPPDSWVPIGLGIGMVKGPEVPGEYRLVLEPVDEEFRQGDSWMINSRVSFDDSFRSFRVGGGMYLDENLQPFTDVILVGTSRDIFVKLDHQGSENTLQADLAFVANGGVQISADFA